MIMGMVSTMKNSSSTSTFESMAGGGTATAPVDRREPAVAGRACGDHCGGSAEWSEGRGEWKGEIEGRGSTQRTAQQEARLTERRDDMHRVAQQSSDTVHHDGDTQKL